jgi:hypothetical protein
MSLTNTNLPNGASQWVLYPGADNALAQNGISDELVNFSGPNGTGTLTSYVQAFTNGDALTFINYPDNSIAEAAFTYAGTGIAFTPSETSVLNTALGTDAFTVAATNSTISNLFGSFSDGGGNPEIGVLTGAFIDYTNGTSAVLQNTPNGPLQTDYSGLNGSGTAVGGVYFGPGTDLGTAFTIAASLPPSHHG